MPSKPGYEAVLHIIECYGLPRQGIAEFNGQPHFFDNIFDEVEDDYSNLYRLTALPHHIVDLAKKKTRVSFGWETNGWQTKPILDLAERDRTIWELKPVLDWVLTAGSEKSFISTGHFERPTGCGWIVTWTGPSRNIPQRTV